MNRLPHQFAHRWHVAINRFAQLDFKNWPSWMYEAKAAADEVPRLTLLFSMERKDKLPSAHRQCSHSATEPVEDNHLTCCMGVECRKCEFLLALDKGDMTGEERDTAKAWTCVAHILSAGKQFDTSEGFVLTTDDRMFWENIYRSMSDDE